jgi:hypothetical protein
MYENFLAEYHLFPDEVDEKFSLRQMSLLLQAQMTRQERQGKMNAAHIWSMVFGDDKKQESSQSSQDKKEEKPMSHFGIAVTEGGED